MLRAKRIGVRNAHACLALSFVAGFSAVSSSASPESGDRGSGATAPGVACTEPPDSLLGVQRAARERLAGVQAAYDAGDFRTGPEQLPAVVAAARRLGDPCLEADTENLLGTCLAAAGFFERAEAAHGRALAAAQRAHDRRRETQALAGRAKAHASRAADAAGLAAFDTVLARARALGDRELEGRTLRDMAQLEMSRGDLLAAVRGFDKALDFARRAGLPRLEANVLSERALALFHTGECGAAIASQEQGLALVRQHGSRGDLIATLAHTGTLCVNLELPSRALGYLREALPLAEESGFVRAVANIHVQMGRIAARLGRLPDALGEYDVALRLTREMHFERFEAGVLRMIGSTQADLGDLEAAERSYEEALHITERFGNRVDIAHGLAEIGAVQERSGELATAEASVRRALALAGTLGRPGMVAEVECQLAGLLASRGRPDDATALYDRAIAHDRALGRPELLRVALAGRSRMARVRGDLELADRLLAEALDIAEAVRAQQGGDEFRVGFLQSTLPLYRDRVALLYERGPEWHAEAFRVAERARARALLDLLGAVRVDPGTGVPEELRQRERTLAARLGRLQAELAKAAGADPGDPARVDSLYREVGRAMREERGACDEIAARSPAYGDLLGYREVLDVESVRARALLPGQVLLEYLVGEAETYLFLVAADRFELHRLPIGASDLNARVEALRATMLHGGDARIPAQDLHAALLDPVAGSLRDGDRLLVAPDGPLYHLPFAALHDGERYLVQRHPIACTPSASVLDRELRPPARARRRSLLAVGNPATFRTAGLLAATRDAPDWRFGELPYAETEVRRIARHYPVSRILIGPAAREETVKSEILRATDVHLATHGLVDMHEPLASGLALAQDEDPREDGVLQVHEILDLRLDADLVALSACNTALGPIAGGEGVLGLMRAFLYAGARQLLLSLWEVQDRSTVELMDGFYAARCGDLLEADRALQRVQLARIEQGAPLRDWAAFVAVGRAEPPVPPSPPKLALWFAGAATLVLAAALAARRVRRAS